MRLSKIVTCELQEQATDMQLRVCSPEESAVSRYIVQCEIPKYHTKQYEENIGWNRKIHDGKSVDPMHSITWCSLPLPAGKQLSHCKLSGCLGQPGVQRQDDGVLESIAASWHCSRINPGCRYISGCSRWKVSSSGSVDGVEYARSGCWTAGNSTQESSMRH